MAQQIITGGNGTTGQTGEQVKDIINENFTEVYGTSSAAQTAANTANADLATHIADTSAAHAASAISVSPFGSIGSTTVQTALEEIAAEAGGSVPDASTTVKGIIEISTDAEAITGTDQTRAITAGNLTAARPKIIQIACSDETTAIVTGTSKVKFRMPQAMTLTAVRASLSTAQTSGSIFTVDINETGATILSTKLTIDNTEKTSTTAATPAVISDTSLADDAEITIDVDQVGDGTAIGLKVTLIGS